MRNQASSWRIVVDLKQNQADVVRLRKTLNDEADLNWRITQSIAAGSDRLARIMASADAFQATAEENVAVHHYANVLFNVLRGGIVADQYNILAKDFVRTIQIFNAPIYDRNEEMLNALPAMLRFDDLMTAVLDTGDLQLIRLANEYLPITFGRRHW